ncbi:MAG: RsmB/NOP family class I SAM-dependent RNA methyltransferase [Thermoplasmata archaeon]|nr:RsmB/NOP family class I SAM-dependent RNA methyltransferase [Thermoplasmata archaeon]
MERVAIAIIKKWLRKGNMARCMRDVLPNSGLNFDEREEVAKIVHSVVRWKRWYDYIMSYYGMEKNAANYLKIAAGEIKINEKEAEDSIPSEKFVAVRQSFSDFLAEFLKDKADFVAHLNEEAKTALCVNLNKVDRKEAMEMLEKEGIKAYEGSIETAIIAESKARYSNLVKKGYAHVQDESSQLIAKITTMHGRKILDYCAGNGGKTLAMTSITKNNAAIYVHDIDEKRIKTLKKRALRHDAKIKTHSGEEKYEVVLVDAPCTGIGAARRNPEAKYVDGVNDFPEKQKKIVNEAWNFVEKDGYLIYSICSFLPEETKSIETIDGIPVELNDERLREYENGYITWLPEGDILFISVRKKSA